MLQGAREFSSAVVAGWYGLAVAGRGEMFALRRKNTLEYKNRIILAFS
jgi:hypothetical protein